MLSSPIILYDHPEVAPESPGDLYDATEIDEILALRVLTLTEDEKAEARGTDPRAAAIIDRCDHMAAAQWERLHGTMRVLGDARAAVGDGALSERPGRRSSRGGIPAGDASVDPWTDTVRVGGVDDRARDPRPAAALPSGRRPGPLPGGSDRHRGRGLS